MRLAFICAFVLAWPIAAISAELKAVDFNRDVRPLLEQACGKCHGPEKQQGGLRFDLREGVVRAGDSGAAAIVAGKPDESELIRRVEASDREVRMPANAEALKPEQIELLRAWIEQGAEWPDSAPEPAIRRGEMVVTDEDRNHWAYRPLRGVDPPSVQDGSWARTDIDRFILSALEAKGLRPNPPADRRVLIRRAYFDVIGLPPSPQEVEAFVADTSPTAYEELIDRLLDNRHYGERWGRHWLDVARYADSAGMETDADRPSAYHYRDFVIRALNDDLSFQTFVRWQIAGDEYESDNPLALAATGLLAAAPSEVLTDNHLEEERLRLRYNELDDMAATTVSAFLGLTLGCCRCHDHKFDAIPTSDYYRLQSAFTTTARSDVLLAPRAEAAAYRKAEARWKEQLRAVEGKAKEEIAAVERSRPQPPPTALAITDKSTEPAPTWLLDRGDFYSKKAQVQLGFLTVLTRSKAPEAYWAAARQEGPVGQSTLQRRALADWLTDADQGAGALLARVMVNRVWQHHFGEGLVRTVNDFGVRSDPPTHPELLEHLAHEFVAQGGRLKRLHRQILTSAVYMQDTAFDEARAEVDPDNRLHWRRRPQRLEAEIVRDAVLAVSGALNPEPYGPAFKPPIPREAIVARNTKDPYPQDAKDTPATRRRSVYMFHKRVVQHPFMQAFDAPDAAVACGRRNITTVAPQALALLNDVFFRDRAADFARRLISEAGDKPEDCVARGYFVALARPPSESERVASVKFLQRQIERRDARDSSLSQEQIRLESLTDFCQTLFAMNEFLYVD